MLGVGKLEVRPAAFQVSGRGMRGSTVYALGMKAIKRVRLPENLLNPP